MSEERTGLVLKSTGSRYLLEDERSGILVTCRLRGVLRLRGSRTTSPVVVGDRVKYEPQETSEGVITEIYPRRNYIIRRASNLSKESHILASNLDQAFLVVSLRMPRTPYEFIDRFLVTASAYGVPAVLVLNKCDLYHGDDDSFLREEFLMIYREAGYEVLETSIYCAESLAFFRSRLQGKISLVCGNSGVGKSSLIQKIEPSLDIRIGEVSESTHRGMHTTTFSQMYLLTGGGYLIDTPGIKGFGLIDLEHREICRYFPELLRYSGRCGYYNCTHTHEPQCGVLEAVQSGAVSLSRYESYLKLLEDDAKYRK